MTLVIEAKRPQSARHLLEASHALMNDLFEPDENHLLSLEALEGDEINFFTASLEGEVVGCGALAARDGYGEVKSMFVSKRARGRGVASALLTRIEDRAKELGFALLRLETGDKLAAARRLYQRHGFAQCPAFGAYQACGDASIFMEKRLLGDAG